MNTLPTAEIKTMSSREIAELTGKQHGHIKRDIEKLCTDLNHPNLDSSNYVHNGNTYTEYHLDKELTLTLITGYNPNLRRVIIKRWQELEQLEKPVIENKPRIAPAQHAAAQLSGYIEASKLLGTAPEMAKAIAVDQTLNDTGVDFNPLLIGHNTVTEVPLIPSKLGELIGKTAQAVNKLLLENGLQVKINGNWAPTELGMEYCSMEPYKAKDSDHSGYRPMWFKRVLEVIASEQAA
ncbi:Rha family transcriptional regulator [Marinibactrum halimedae]|uniref:Rha family transcriptional regulator n=1 Tax=Marinibactrum halimedae TaxID=1444977 RepID=A0AA37TAD3_9GAMM|nr:Rha family transcriptional regulator [Marinibactrum halimedae]MCD9458900.1 Rha family transcriptional regulator [Marinibactrum halimedae]GLS27748.1 hypothetical protein GCM10007877_34670 [Marinibactrum halimedae]